jgi:hypothetical protein
MQGLEIRVVAGESPILRVQRDRSFQVGNGFRVLVALGMGDGKHVQGVIVVWVLVANEAEMDNGLIVLAAVDGERCRVEAFVDRLRRILPLRGLALTDVQIQAHPLVQFLLIRVLSEHGFQSIDGGPVVMPLQRLESAFVKRNGFEICGPTLRCRRSDGLLRF